MVLKKKVPPVTAPKKKPPPKTRRAASSPNPNAPKYTWAPWGTTGVVHDNCYDYAFGSFSNNRTRKSIPGEVARMSSNGLNFKSCNGIATRVLADNPGNVYQMKNPDARVRPGFYKVMCFVAPSNDFGNSSGDFHWYKEIRAIRYKTRPNDKVGALARFFHVPARVIVEALVKARSSANTNNGRVANDDITPRVVIGGPQPGQLVGVVSHAELDAF